MELLIYYDLFYILSHNTCEIIVTRDSRERDGEREIERQRERERERVTKRVNERNRKNGNNEIFYDMSLSILISQVLER